MSLLGREFLVGRGVIQHLLGLDIGSFITCRSVTRGGTGAASVGQSHHGAADPGLIGTGWRRGPPAPRAIAAVGNVRGPRAWVPRLDACEISRGSEMA